MDFKNILINEPDDNGDGIVVLGPYEDNPALIKNVKVDFLKYKNDHESLDENISFIDHANSIVQNSVFSNGIKLALVGNGDFPNKDKGTKVIFENCIFENFGRRGIETQDGISVTMKNCVIRNWGLKEWFDVRSFASWAHRGALIELDHCYFIQSSFFQSGFINFIFDILNHIGNSINERDISWKTFLPGVTRGAIGTSDGYVHCSSCFKNKKWIVLENSENEIINPTEAFEGIKNIYQKCEYQLPKEVSDMFKI